MNLGKEKTKFTDRPKVDALGQEQIARSKGKLFQFDDLFQPPSSSARTIQAR